MPASLLPSLLLPLPAPAVGPEKDKRFAPLRLLRLDPADAEPVPVAAAATEEEEEAAAVQLLELLVGEERALVRPPFSLPRLPSADGKDRPEGSESELMVGFDVRTLAPDAPHVLEGPWTESHRRTGVCASGACAGGICSLASAASAPAALLRPLAARYSWIICQG